MGTSFETQCINIQTKLNVMKLKPGLGTFMQSGQETDWAHCAGSTAHKEHRFYDTAGQKCANLPAAFKFCSRIADFDSILSRVSLIKSSKDFCYITTLSL